MEIFRHADGILIHSPENEKEEEQLLLFVNNVMSVDLVINDSTDKCVISLTYNKDKENKVV